MLENELNAERQFESVDEGEAVPVRNVMARA